MSALLFVFLLHLAVVLARSAVVSGASQPSRKHKDGLTLRLLQGNHRVWVKGAHGEQPLEVGSIVTSMNELSLGRAPGNDIRLEDPFSSAFHARIRRQRQGFLIEDLDTTNGTRVNGVRIRTPVRIEVGDIIDVGSTSFAVE
ncbi:MAG: FHA domain-containing protein [Firmicutes bacterium]|jgi:hypothetical protein|nr:FHA domain-containing protein [Bacillota bacterium]